MHKHAHSCRKSWMSWFSGSLVGNASALVCANQICEQQEKTAKVLEETFWRRSLVKEQVLEAD